MLGRFDDGLDLLARCHMMGLDEGSKRHNTDMFFEEDW